VKVFRIQHQHSDIGAGDYRKTVAVLENVTIATLVAEALNDLTGTKAGLKHGFTAHDSFYVVSETVNQAVSESRVPGIVAEILKTHFKD
jgi:hypothetical protein